MRERTYIAIDLKSFFASVECVERGLDPLKTNLVVADAGRTEKTICLAITPPLKAYGLSGRSRLFQVVQKARECGFRYITAPPRMAYYIEYSSRVYNVYLRYFSAEDIHVYSIDEVFIDATCYLKLYGTDARTLCRNVIRDVLASTGITATAGIAPNLFLCKVAMDIVAKHIPADSDGVRIAELDTGTFRRTLWNHRPLTDFWRIGPGTAARLERCFMFTLGDIAERSLTPAGEKMLYRIFGVDAEILIDHAWGYEPCTIADIKKYKSRSRSLSSGQVLPRAYSSREAELIVKEMTELMVMELIERKLAASGFTLTLCYDGFEGIKPSHRSVSFHCHTASPSLISRRVNELYRDMVDSCQDIRRIYISADNVVYREAEEPDLFSDPAEASRERILQETLIGIKKKFGKNAVIKGHSLEKWGTARERNNQIGGHRA